MKSYGIIISILIFFSSCRAFNEGPDEVKLGGVRWQLMAIGQRPATNIADKAFIEFDEPELEIAGKAACNSIFAEYVPAPANKLKIENIGSTKMYCEGLMDQENQIISGLENVKRYEIKYGLLYLYNSDELLLTFKKVDKED